VWVALASQGCDEEEEHPEQVVLERDCLVMSCRDCVLLPPLAKPWVWRRGPRMTASPWRMKGEESFTWCCPGRAPWRGIMKDHSADVVQPCLVLPGSQEDESARGKKQPVR